MGSALASGLRAAGVQRKQVVLSDPDTERLKRSAQDARVRSIGRNAKAIVGAQAIVLAVKPHIVRQVLAEVSRVVQPEQLIISLAAGVPLEALESQLPAGQPVIRAMPNLAMKVHAAATGLCANEAVEQRHVSLALAMFSAVGEAFFVEESQMHAVTALSGSGPAYVFLIAEALAAGGVKMGLPATAAMRLAAQTLLGAGKLMLESGEHPAVLRDQVTTPGGTTIYGLHELEQQAVRGALTAAVEAAAGRSQELFEAALARAAAETDER